MIWRTREGEKEIPCWMCISFDALLPPAIHCCCCFVSFSLPPLPSQPRALQLISRVIFPSSSLSPSSFLRCVDVISIYLNIHFRCTLNFQIFFLLYKQTLLYCCCCFLFLCVCALYAQYRPISCSHHWLLIPNHPICAFHYSNTISKDIYMNTFVLPTFIVVVIGATKVCQ